MSLVKTHRKIPALGFRGIIASVSVCLSSLGWNSQFLTVGPQVSLVECSPLWMASPSPSPGVIKQGKQRGVLEGWKVVSLDLERFEMDYEEEASERLRRETGSET